MSDSPTAYRMSCPCQGKIIEGGLFKIHGPDDAERADVPSVGAIIVCQCGCLHRVREIDDVLGMVVVEELTPDEVIQAHRDLGMDVVKVVCPHCEYMGATAAAEGQTFADGYVFACPQCEHPFVTDGQRDGDELRTRTLTPDERHQIMVSLMGRAASLGMFGMNSGPGARVDTPFGNDPFSPFGGSS